MKKISPRPYVDSTPVMRFIMVSGFISMIIMVGGTVRRIYLSDSPTSVLSSNASSPTLPAREVSSPDFTSRWLDAVGDCQREESLLLGTSRERAKWRLYAISSQARSLGLQGKFGPSTGVSARHSDRCVAP